MPLVGDGHLYQEERFVPEMQFSVLPSGGLFGHFGFYGAGSESEKILCLKKKILIIAQNNIGSEKKVLEAWSRDLELLNYSTNLERVHKWKYY